MPSIGMLYRGNVHLQSLEIINSIFKLALEGSFHLLSFFKKIFKLFYYILTKMNKDV
jgi:hypothetical protein